MTSATIHQLCTNCAVAYAGMSGIDTTSTVDALARLEADGHLVPVNGTDSNTSLDCEACGLDQLSADRTFIRPATPTRQETHPMNAWLATHNPATIDALADRIAECEPERIDHANGDRQFAVWMLLVDRKVRNYTGHAVTDLPDWGWRDAYDDDMSPHDAFADALAHWIDVEGP